MATQSALGTTISISDDAPPTDNQAGYEDASVIYTEIGEVTDFPSVALSTYTQIDHQPLAGNGLTQKFKGSNDAGSPDMTMAYDRGDPGQVLLKTALDDRNGVYTFRVVHQDGTKTYFRGRVMSVTEEPGTINTMLTSTVQVAITTTPVLGTA